MPAGYAGVNEMSWEQLVTRLRAIVTGLDSAEPADRTVVALNLAGNGTNTAQSGHTR